MSDPLTQASVRRRRGEDQEGDWAMSEYSKMVTNIAAQVVDESTMHDADKSVIAARLRGMQEALDSKSNEITALREAMRVLGKSISDVLGSDDWPELTNTMRQGLGCGLEDRGIHDRYRAAEYGYEDALERCHEFIHNATADVDANPLAAAAVREAQAKEQA